MGHVSQLVGMPASLCFAKIRLIGGIGCFLGSLLSEDTGLLSPALLGSSQFLVAPGIEQINVKVKGWASPSYAMVGTDLPTAR